MHKTLFDLAVLSLIVVSVALNPIYGADENPGLKSLQLKLRETNPTLADDFDSRLTRALTKAKQPRGGHVIFGRVEVEGDQDPRAVVAQMFILQDGYFVDAVGTTEKPVGFRLTGYESVLKVPQGSSRARTH